MSPIIFSKRINKQEKNTRSHTYKKSKIIIDPAI